MVCRFTHTQHMHTLSLPAALLMSTYLQDDGYGSPLDGCGQPVALAADGLDQPGGKAHGLCTCYIQVCQIL
jgi:hypothetical protein